MIGVIYEFFQEIKYYMPKAHEHMFCLKWCRFYILYLVQIENIKQELYLDNFNWILCSTVT